MTDHAYQVRRATVADAAMLAELGARTFVDSFGADNAPEDMSAYISAAFNPERQARELSEPGSTFLILELEERAVGYAHVRSGAAPPAVDASRPVELVRLYVSRDRIGTGGGARLMRECLELAAAEGRDAMWLGVWERNERAVRFYRKWGFSHVGSHTFQLGGDRQTDWLMAKRMESIDVAT
jgi:GNAT superfamily N-acetyltransferase